ncbi:MAG: hypothetical protein JNG90_09625 [Planctomycetaceae bacterium]|nr:hypothetical protein [Planctomycetaceae bacterium]
MQLDQTRIAIRERSFGDLLDLALRVLRTHAPALCVTWMLGAVPAAALNIWLLGDSVTYQLESGLTEDQVVEALFGSGFQLALLLIMEVPWVAMLTTLYLGQAMFVERPSPRQLAADAVRSLPQMFLFQLVIRALLLPWIITWLVLYGSWPFLNEIILLERNPVRKSSRHPALTSTFNRNQVLHSRSTGELFGRWIFSLVLGGALMGSIWLTLWRGWAILWDTNTTDWTTFVVFPQIAIWTVLGYFTIVRFLSYLDLRIRNEGWEIELKMRAEAARLARQVA